MGEENSCCPIVKAMKLLGGKWKLPILFRLMGGQTRFSALASLIPDVSRKVLSEQLKQMEKDGLVHRKQFDQTHQKLNTPLPNTPKN
jgi:DNA-binding HxlR family transcriptional regulator